MSTDRPQHHAIHVEDRIKKYEYALKVLIALEHMFCSLDKTAVYQGKKLRIPDAESDRGEREVTPDMAVETTGQKRPYRAVVEIKESLPALPKDWDGVIDQLEKYRLATGGWDSAVSDMPHDVMLATDTPHAGKFASWLRNDHARSDMAKWLVVVMVVTTKYNDKEFMKIARVHGRISSLKIDSELSLPKGYQIPLYKVMRKMGRMKFYDSNPPVEYTMAILWDHVFSKFVHAKKLQKIMDGEKVTISVSMKQIQKKIKSFAPRTNQGCVRRSWISDAMSTFEKISVVSRRDGDSFVISYMTHSMPTTDWIMSRTAKLQDGRARRVHQSPRRTA